MIHVAQVVAAGHTQSALAADYPTQGERAADERPEERGVEESVDEEATRDRSQWQSSGQATLIRAMFPRRLYGPCADAA